MNGMDESLRFCQDALVGGVMDPPDEALIRRSIRGLLDIGPQAVYAALSGWAQVYWHGEPPDQSGEFWGLKAVNLTSGSDVNPDSAVRNGDDWGSVAAMRFIVAQRNEDWATTLAIFESVPDSDAAAALLVAVLQLATDRGRAVVAEQRGDL